MSDQSIAVASYIGVGLCAVIVMALKGVEWANYQMRDRRKLL